MAAECQTNSRQTGLYGDLKLQCALCNSLVEGIGAEVTATSRLVYVLRAP